MLQNHVHHQLHAVNSTLNISCAVVARNTSSVTCHFVLSNTRRAVFARLINFACLAFQAAQHGLGSFASVEQLSINMHTATVGMINMHSLLVFRCPENICFVLLSVIALRSSIYFMQQSEVSLIRNFSINILIYNVSDEKLEPYVFRNKIAK